MRRVVPKLRAATHVVVCVFCVAAIGWWVRSYKVADRVFWVREGSKAVAVSTSKGRLLVSIATRPREGGVVGLPAGVNWFTHGPIAYDPSGPLPDIWPTAPQRGSGVGVRERTHTTHWALAGIAAQTGYVQDVRRVASLTQTRPSFVVVPLSPRVAYAHRFLVPLWAIVLLTGTWPLLSLARVLRKRRRPGSGHCPQCGYDLRATPGRCPECGSVHASTDAAMTSPQCH